MIYSPCVPRAFGQDLGSVKGCVIIVILGEGPEYWEAFVVDLWVCSLARLLACLLACSLAHSAGMCIDARYEQYSHDLNKNSRRARKNSLTDHETTDGVRFRTSSMTIRSRWYVSLGYRPCCSMAVQP